MKKALSLILSVMMCLCVFTACGDDKESAEAESAYSGILTKVKLGMPLTKIITLQPGTVDLYYENDTTIWSINPDTDLLPELRALIPQDNAFQYADDSIITYYFETVKGDPEIYLNGFSEEVHCVIDRAAAEDYFNKKTEQLIKKHCGGTEATANGVMTGTEDIDMTLEYSQKLSASSYTVTFTMTLTYMTVDDVEGYYATKFAIDLKEKAVKGEVAISTPEVSKEEKK